jgi:hypothetical protein
MADPKKPLLSIAESAPGVATAAAQKGLQKNEVSKIAALVELRNLHNELTSLPQNEAYKKYQTLNKTTRAALTSTFDPKYIKEDKGFIGNILNSVKSAVYYGGGTTKDLVNNFADIAGGGILSIPTKVIGGTVKGLFNEVKDTSVGEVVTEKVSAGLDVVVRPQNKLVKQPYMAARIAEDNGGNPWTTLAQGLGAGFKELMPGGEDALPTGTGTAFEQYWAKASDPNSVFDEKAVAEFNSDLTPAASYLGRLLASKQDLIDNYEQFQDNPGVIDLVNRYVSGETEALKEVADATARFEKSKISPGRDYARVIVGLLPHEAEKAILGDGAAKAIFTALSAPVDFTVTMGLDPLIIAGKLNRAVMVAKYGFFKVGEGSISIEKAFNRPAVRAYWDEAGKLVETYRNGDLATRAQTLNRLQDRFPEININVVEDLAKADVRNADDALTFFDNGQRFVDMMSGNAGIAGKDALIPRMTFARGIGNDVKDTIVKTLGTERYSNLNIGKTEDEFIAQFSDSPDVWANKIGLEKTGLVFTAKDKSTAAKIDRVVRQFSIAPVVERTISIADGSSATQVYRLARTVLDKNSAGAFRAAWLSADEGQRLLMYKGLLKTLGVGMGLNLSNEGRLVLSKIDDMSKELYSVSQSALDIGDLADVLRTVKNGGLASAPKGVRAKTQEAMTSLSAEGKASRLISSTNAKITEYIERSKALKLDRREAKKAGDEERAAAIADEIKIVGAKLGRELKTQRALKLKFGTGKKVTDKDEVIALLNSQRDEGFTVDNLKQFEESIVDYTNGSGNYSLVNSYLRGDKTGWMKSEIAKAEKIIDDLDALIEQAPKLNQAIVTYRGIADKKVAEELLNLKPGQSFTDSAFVSTTLREEIAEGFARFNGWEGKQGKSGVIVEITNPFGTKGIFPLGFRTNVDEKFVTRANAENEFLLPRDTEFYITEISGNRIKVIAATPDNVSSAQGRAVVSSKKDITPIDEENFVRAANPNIYSTAYVGLVDVNFLKKFLEFDRTKNLNEGGSGIPGWSAEKIAEITDDLKQGKGFNNHLVLDYWLDENGKLLLRLVEGNHRVQAAIAAGIDSVPVRVMRGSQSTFDKGIPTGIQSKILPDRAGYIPGQVFPGDILPDEFVKTARQAAAKEAAIPETVAGRTARTVDDTELDNVDDFLLDRFNAGQTADGTPRAVRLYQLDDYRSLPDFAEWREIAHRAGVFTELFGRVTNNHASKMVADGWSFGNLYPRLGLRSSVEEVGMYGIIGGAEGFGYFIKARAASRALRAATQPGIKTTVFGNEKTDKNLGIIYDNLYKITKKHYSQEELLAMADDPVRLGQAVANSMIKNRFRPEFLNTRRGQEIANWSGDFAEFNGKAILDDINGSSVRAERPITEAEEISNSLKQFGPSVRFNVQNQEALKGMTFGPEFTEIANTNEKFVFNWFLELNNTVGQRNGQFGNIVLWNAGKKSDVVIKKLVDYINGDGEELAKRFAIYAEQGPEGLARSIYLDSTYPLRNYAGQINMDLVNAIRNKGGMDKFTVEDLIKLDKPYARPESILGREIIPLTGANAEQVMYRVINSGYGWMGKQIALLDREPITLGNYFMFRNELKGTQEATKKSLMANGLTEEGADSIARFSAHENALNLARNRTLAFVDNGDVRTNLAYSLRTLGRYYRATEDFYRRLARLGKYEKRAIVRLAIANQTFENTGFIHKDDKGQMYFTYPGDDLFAGAITKTLSLMGLTTYSPVPVNFGGYVKMLTPSLDPESQLPGLSNPLVSLSLDAMSNLPFIGEYVSGVEKLLTGARNTDIPAWEKAAPANLKRLYNFLAGSPEGTESRFSSAVKAIKLLVSTGNGPTNAANLQSFYENVTTQARNVDAVKLIMGQATIASIQGFGNKDVPKELADAGVFTWDTEFQKIMKKFDGDKDALSKALVQFAKLYPSKLAYTNFGTDTTTFASFRKTIEAEKFVRNNQELLIEHADAGSFFIPVSGQTDLNSYSYLKQKGYISNKPLDPRVAQGKENFIRQVATTGARMAFYQLTDEYNAKIAAEPTMAGRRYWRNELDVRKKGLLTAYPLLGLQVTPNEESNKRRIEVISDMKSLLASNKAPNQDLADTFGAMLNEYDQMNATLQRVVGSSDKANEFKKNLKSDTRDTLLKLAESSDNATTFFYSVLEPLIGD